MFDNYVISIDNEIDKKIQINIKIQRGVRFMFRKKFDIKEYVIILFFLILFVFLSITAQGFFTSENLFNVARQVSMMGIVSVGMTFIIITGGIDLSVGSVLAASGCVAAYLMVDLQMDAISASIIGILVGGVVGAINGFLVTKVNIPAFVATLSTMTIARGLAYIVTQAEPIYGFPKKFSLLGQGHVWVFPIPVLIMILAFAFGYIVLNRIPLGRYIFAIGGNDEAAKLSGINANKVKMFVYTVTGLFAGLAGVILLSRMNTGIASSGQNFELDVITAVILGGVSISGGEGKLRGVILGVCIMGILSNGLIILGVQEYYQLVVRGVVLALAVALDKNSQILSKKLWKTKV